MECERMRIIILGTGPVACTLAGELSKRGHAVTVVDDCQGPLDQLKQHYDLATVFGRPSYPDVLHEAGAKHADVLLAVSDSDELNMVSCQVAHSLFSVPKKIARIKSPHYFVRRELFGNLHMPIDIFINPENLLAQLIKGLIKVPQSTYFSSLAHTDYLLIGLHIGPDSQLINLTFASHSLAIKDLVVPVIAMYRDKKLMRTFKNRHVRVHDELYFLIEAVHLDQFVAHLYSNLMTTETVLLAGGGHVGLATAKGLAQEYTVKVIDRNYGRCQYLSEQLEGVVILHGDVTDRQLIEQEHIEHCDVYCALTNDDEDNILSALQARYLGAKRIISLVNRSNYVDVLEHDYLHVTVSPQHETIYAILSHLTFPGVLKVHGLVGRGAELIEMRVLPSMQKTMVGKKISTLCRHADVHCVAIMREGHCLVEHLAKSVCRLDDVIIFLVATKEGKEALTAKMLSQP
jgi:trk system potassium uptake protein